MPAVNRGVSSLSFKKMQRQKIALADLKTGLDESGSASGSSSEDEKKRIGLQRIFVMVKVKNDHNIIPFYAQVPSGLCIFPGVVNPVIHQGIHQNTLLTQFTNNINPLSDSEDQITPSHIHNILKNQPEQKICTFTHQKGEQRTQDKQSRRPPDTQPNRRRCSHTPSFSQCCKCQDGDDEPSLHIQEDPVLDDLYIPITRETLCFVNECIYVPDLASSITNAFMFQIVNKIFRNLIYSPHYSLFSFTSSSWNYQNQPHPFLCFLNVILSTQALDRKAALISAPLASTYTHTSFSCLFPFQALSPLEKCHNDKMENSDSSDNG
ncbi:hypothetical protein VP01_4541g1 [Puccinia sorghi]|uniref:Uncharacterized protein n=1 Tax=Puccinia sorghi TaxID=27349 RepID=A0A0L6UNT7_9BASI|nr:hypothetical protein VP01_4541g1 [Puccinia sorghi]